MIFKTGLNSVFFFVLILKRGSADDSRVCTLHDLPIARIRPVIAPPKLEPNYEFFIRLWKFIWVCAAVCLCVCVGGKQAGKVLSSHLNDRPNKKAN